MSRAKNIAHVDTRFSITARLIAIWRELFGIIWLACSDTPPVWSRSQGLLVEVFLLLDYQFR